MDSEPMDLNRSSMNDNGSETELWTGHDSIPARPIPWSEIIEHHISLIEGHIKMMHMVKKHTTESSGNYASVLEMVERAKSMLVDAEKVRSIFVPLPEQPQKIPLGSPSIFTYPGHSPAHRKSGGSVKKHKTAHHQDAQLGIHRDSSSPRLRETKAQGQVNQATLNSNGTNGKHGSKGATASATGERINANEEAGLQDGAEASFVVDTNPTPLNLSKLEIRGVSTMTDAPREDGDEGRKRKKPKKRHDGDLPLPPAETVDITEEVELRLKEKDEKKRRKQEKKRRRESEKSNGALSEAAEERVEAPVKGSKADEKSLDKPQKKKTKTKHSLTGEQLPNQPQGKKRTGDDEHTAEDGEGKEKSGRKRRKAEKTKTHALR